MKQIMTHNKNIKNFVDISHQVELEAKSQEVTKSATLIAYGVQSKDKGKARWA